MSNFLLQDPDCVLIHIPKTGGTSIRKGVWQKNYKGPVFGKIPKRWDGHFKFAFVRHPFDRLISAWRMFTVGAKGDPNWQMPQDARQVSLEDFCDIVCDDSVIYDQRRASFEEKIRHHTIPQTHPFNCLEAADFVGRFERLPQDFAVICARLGIERELPHMHRTSHEGWSAYLTPALMTRMEAYYAEDFARLGYSAAA